MKRHYAGWSIYDNGPGHPVTGRFFAKKWGVQMGANTEELLIRMIDLRVKEDRARFGPTPCGTENIL